MQYKRREFIAPCFRRNQFLKPYASTNTEEVVEAAHDAEAVEAAHDDDAEAVAAAHDEQPKDRISPPCQKEQEHLAHYC